ncbi:hypothetical protein ACWD5Q_31440 [Streptomyces sp. NPDC002513]
MTRLCLYGGDQVRDPFDVTLAELKPEAFLTAGQAASEALSAAAGSMSP